MASSFEVWKVFQDRLVAQAVGQQIEDVDGADPQALAQALRSDHRKEIRDE